MHYLSLRILTQLNRTFEYLPLILKGGCDVFSSHSLLTIFGIIVSIQFAVPNELRIPISLPIHAPLSQLTEQALLAKDQFKECDRCPEMIVVPSGSFTMGSPENEISRINDEGPLHVVTFARPFAVGKYAVTFDDWDACLADRGCRGYRPDDLGWGRGKRPVINLRCEDAEAYIEWLKQTTLRNYRFLSEAEFEYIARAGTQSPFWTGPTITSEQANYDGEFPYSSGPRGIFRKRTVPVGYFPPNQWGLHEIIGNVFTWTGDCYHRTYVGAPTDGRAWVNEDCERIVFRGGAWKFPPWHLRSAARGWIAVNKTSDVVGLRVARTLQ